MEGQRARKQVKMSFEVLAIASALLVSAICNAQFMKLRDAVSMVQVARLEAGDHDPLSNSLTRTMEEAKEAIRTTTTTGSDTNAIAESFVQKVKDIVKANGIDVVLPLDCGRNPRSLGGRNPLDDKFAPFPWLAALGSREHGIFHFRCTGVVISEFHILTDGNCVTSVTINMVQLNVTSLPGNHPVENFVVGRRVHPSIRTKKDFITGHNIGILELAYPIRFNEFVQPICLPGLLDEDSTRQTKRFTTTLVGFRNIADSTQGRTGNLFLIPDSTTDFAPKCSIEIKNFNKENPDKISTLYDILTEDHICVYKNFETSGKSLVLKEEIAAGNRRVKVVGVGGIANARTPVPIAFTSIQSHRFWIELVVKKFMDNTADRRGG